jgi:hypothetical protein
VASSCQHGDKHGYKKRRENYSLDRQTFASQEWLFFTGLDLML